jgi:hypothetical protein
MGLNSFKTRALSSYIDELHCTPVGSDDTDAHTLDDTRLVVA